MQFLKYFIPKWLFSMDRLFSIVLLEFFRGKFRNLHLMLSFLIWSVRNKFVQMLLRPLIPAGTKRSSDLNLQLKAATLFEYV